MAKMRGAQAAAPDSPCRGLPRVRAATAPRQRGDMCVADYKYKVEEKLTHSVTSGDRPQGALLAACLLGRALRITHGRRHPHWSATSSPGTRSWSWLCAWMAHGGSDGADSYTANGVGDSVWVCARVPESETRDCESRDRGGCVLYESTWPCGRVAMDHYCDAPM